VLCRWCALLLSIGCTDWRRGFCHDLASQWKSERYCRICPGCGYVGLSVGDVRDPIEQCCSAEALKSASCELSTVVVGESRAKTLANIGNSKSRAFRASDVSKFDCLKAWAKHEAQHATAPTFRHRKRRPIGVLCCRSPSPSPVRNCIQRPRPLHRT
jgi:hypothetical protein